MPFITRTILIKVLGAEYLGLNSLFVSILQVLSISELGLGSAIVFSMYKPIAQDDNDTLCALLNVYRKLYHIVGIIILVGGLVLLPFLPNLITDAAVIPELLLHQCTPDAIDSWLQQLLPDTARRQAMLDGYDRMARLLTAKDCTASTASGIIQYLNSHARH